MGLGGKGVFHKGLGPSRSAIILVTSSTVMKIGSWVSYRYPSKPLLYGTPRTTVLYTDGFYPVKTFCYYYFYINNNNNINIIIIIIIIIIHTPKPFCVRVMGNRSFPQFGPEGHCFFLVRWHILFSITFQS